MKRSQLERIEEGQRRIEAKLDILISALADDPEQEEKFDLDGSPLDAGERDQTQSLD